MVVYYFAWLFGTLFDTDSQERIYLAPPAKRKLPSTAFMIMVLIAVVFGILCAINTYPYFLIFLCVFWCIDIFASNYMKTKIISDPMAVTLAAHKSSREFLSYERARALKNYFYGTWRLWRRYGGGVFLAALVVLVFAELDVAIASLIHLSPAFLSSALILMYVLFIECWIWSKRLELWFAFRFLDALGNEYSLTLRNEDVDH